MKERFDETKKGSSNFFDKFDRLTFRLVKRSLVRVVIFLYSSVFKTVEGPHNKTLVLQLLKLLTICVGAVNIKNSVVLHSGVFKRLEVLIIHVKGTATKNHWCGRLSIPNQRRTCRLNVAKRPSKRENELFKSFSDVKLQTLLQTD